MKITRASDYAMRALMYIAEKPKGAVFMRADLSKICDVPDSFLGKIMQGLAKADILVSERGKKGGFRMEKAPENISMYDVIVAIEGEIRITDCLADRGYCQKTGYCNVHLAWQDIQSKLVDQLKSITIKDLM